MKDYFQEYFGLTAQEAQLTEIMRQKDVCGIVDASKQIRRLYNAAPEDGQMYGSQKLWGFLPFRRYKDIQLHRKRLCLYALCHCPIVATFAPMYQKMYSYGFKERL